MIRKKIVFSPGVALLSITLAVLSVPKSYAQDECSSREFLDETSSKLKDFRFLKAFKLEVEDPKSQSGDQQPVMTYQVVLSKNTTYKIITNSSGGKEEEPIMVARLTGPGDRRIASSYNRRKRKHYSVVGFKCKATGIYTIEFSFRGEGDGCGVSILGFKRNRRNL